MCYKKPGPRCSAHTKADLDKCYIAYQESPSEETLDAYKRAQEEFLKTPEGFKVLEKCAEKDRNAKWLLEENKANRALAIRKFKTLQEPDSVCTPSGIVQHASTVNIGYAGRKPKWWSEYSKECRQGDVTTEPEMLDVISTFDGSVAVIWESQSQSSADEYVQESGYNVSRCILKDMKTGENVGYLKVTSITDESIRKSFGDGPESLFSYAQERTEYSSRGIDAMQQGASYEDVRMDLVESAFSARTLRAKPVKINGVLINGSNFRDFSHDPEVVEKVLDSYRDSIRSHQAELKEHLPDPFVDYSRLENAYKGSGLGTAMYVYTARRLAQQGLALSGSGIQSDAAQRLWKNMERYLGDKVKERSVKGKVKPLLDYR